MEEVDGIQDLATVSWIKGIKEDIVPMFHQGSLQIISEVVAEQEVNFLFLNMQARDIIIIG